MKRRVRTTQVMGLVAVIVLTSWGLASAQPAAADPAFERMRTKIKEGDRLTVHLMNGSTVEGRVMDATPDAMSISTDVGERRLPMRDVAVVKRHGHGIILGSIIGAGVGLTFGVIVGSIYANEGNDSAGPLFGLTLLGLGAGAGIDALVNIPRTVYQQSPSRTTFKLEAGPHRTAVRVVVAF